jgi:SAM-dependent methyltransferase
MSLSLGKQLMPQGWHDALQFDREPVRQFMIRELLPRIKRGDRVLDAGSGNTNEQRIRAELIATGAALQTLDFMAGDGIDLVADITSTGLPSASYDVVVCLQVLEHVQEPAAVCRELARLVKPGGLVAISAPQSYWLHNLPYHYFHFTREGLALLCHEAGLEPQVLEPQGGHFMLVGHMLHYTCRVLEQRARGNNWAAFCKPFFIVLRLLLGLVVKSLCLGLDRLMPDETNTLGWNLICQKSSTIASPHC